MKSTLSQTTARSQIEKIRRDKGLGGGDLPTGYVSDLEAAIAMYV